MLCAGGRFGAENVHPEERTDEMKIIEKLAARNRNAGACAPVLIAFIGDSVTHGCFEVTMDEMNRLIGVVYDPENGYPNRLKRRLDAMYPAASVSILNAGVGGECAVHGAERLERDVLSRRPDLVVVAFALNDSMNADVEGGLAEYRAAMEDMVVRIQDSGAECIVQTPNRMCSYVSAIISKGELRNIAAQAARVQNDGVLAAYAQAARDVAAAHGVPVADAYRLWDQMAKGGVDTTELLSNHINHPTREMHDLFVKALLDVMLFKN